MKRSVRILAASVVAVLAGCLAGALVAPADATHALGGRVEFGGLAGGSITRTAFEQPSFTSGGVEVPPSAHCDASVVSGPLNGLDARILDVSAYAGKALTITWTAERKAPPAPAVLPGLAVTFFSSKPDCRYFGPLGRIDRMDTTGSFMVTAPADVKWIVVAPHLVTGVTFTIAGPAH